MLYDGLGNPVGFSFLKRAFRASTRPLAPLASLFPVPGAGLLTQVPNGRFPCDAPSGPAARRLQRAPPPEWCSSLPLWRKHFNRQCRCSAAGTVGGFYGRGTGAANTQAIDAAPPMPTQALQPPPGWIPRPSLPGRKGRIYLRCVSWRGPKGWSRGCRTGAPAPAVVAQPVPPGPVVMGRRFARRRRR
jgi:hypothetical protein